MSAAQSACWVLSAIQCVVAVAHFMDPAGFVPPGDTLTVLATHLIAVLGVTHLAMGFMLASAAATQGVGMRKCIAGIYGTWYAMAAFVAGYAVPIDGPARYITSAFAVAGLVAAFVLPDNNSKGKKASASGTPSRSSRSKTR